MFKFFRRIRQRLLSENRFSKYLLYAIGEIVLVVIGILIALEIDTRHDISKNNQLELKILKEISSDLKSDMQGLSEDIVLMDSISNACNEIKETLRESDAPTPQFGYALNYLRITPHFDPNTSGYELLSSKGIELITNDSLRRAISRLYEIQYPYYRRYENERIQYVELHVEPELLRYVTFTKDPDRYLKSNAWIDSKLYGSMRDDEQFLKRVSGIDVENHYVHMRAGSTLEMIRALYEFITNELNERV
ncbi:MAG: hypothetical protein HKN79_09130 [Flavobacteriales bacterium]|nr:hypothetical protein [Flavobacteriales bacterium]